MNPTAGPVDPHQFREVMGHYPTGVVVVTGIADDGEPIGLVVGTFSSVSLEPPLVSFMPTTNSYQFARLRTASVYCINVLAHDQQELCRLMAAPRPGKFEQADWSLSDLGAPVLADSLAVIHCITEKTVEAGDHFIELCSVLRMEVTRPVPPLLFFQGGYGAFALGGSAVSACYDFIARAQLAYVARPHLEALSRQLDCATEVLVVANESELTTAVRAGNPSTRLGSTVGDRIPLIPPVGTSYLAWADEDVVTRWLSRAASRDEAVIENYRRWLRAVKTLGYSVVRMGPEGGDLETLIGTLREYTSSHLTPARERAVRDAMGNLTDLFEPIQFASDQTYDIAALQVPVHEPDGRVRMILRCCDVPREAGGDQVNRWISLAKAAAARIERDLASQEGTSTSADVNWYELAYVV